MVPPVLSRYPRRFDPCYSHRFDPYYPASSKALLPLLSSPLLSAFFLRLPSSPRPLSSLERRRRCPISTSTASMSPRRPSPPLAAIDLHLRLELCIHNLDFFAFDYYSVVASVSYRICEGLRRLLPRRRARARWDQGSQRRRSRISPRNPFYWTPLLRLDLLLLHNCCSAAAFRFKAIFFMILALIVIFALVLAGTKDPGIIPRNENPELEEVGASVSRSRIRRISINGVQIKLKHCRICNIFRPPRSCHCTVCDKCVEKFDHHCPWIGQCIGLRNYRCYLIFVVSALVFFTYVSAFTLWRIRREVARSGSGMIKLLGCAPETFALALFSFAAVCFLAGLSVFHAYLITINQTARENFKRGYAKSPNPFDKGMLRNIKEALFMRLPPSNVDFRAFIEPNWGAIAKILMNSSPKGVGDHEEAIA